MSRYYNRIYKMEGGQLFVEARTDCRTAQEINQLRVEHGGNTLEFFPSPVTEVLQAGDSKSKEKAIRDKFAMIDALRAMGLTVTNRQNQEVEQ